MSRTSPTSRELNILSEMVSNARLDGREIIAATRPGAQDGEVFSGLPVRSGDLGILIAG